MKCHYVQNEIAGKVLIPGCYSTVHSNDIKDCTCPPPNTAYKFEKERFNKAIKERDSYIEQLEAEVKRLKSDLSQLRTIYQLK